MTAASNSFPKPRRVLKYKFILFKSSKSSLKLSDGFQINFVPTFCPDACSLSVKTKREKKEKALVKN